MAILVISYSREDRLQVRAVVNLLRAAMSEIEEAVFWDDDLKPGARWLEQLKAAIDDAPQLFVFWCAHAKASNEVRREYAYALEQGKVVIPVLLDSTALPKELRPIQGIDFRAFDVHRVQIVKRSRKRKFPEDVGGGDGGGYDMTDEFVEYDVAVSPRFRVKEREAMVSAFRARFLVK